MRAYILFPKKKKQKSILSPSIKENGTIIHLKNEEWYLAFNL